MKHSLTAIVCSLTSLTIPASAVVVNVNGFDYDISTFNTTYNDSADHLSSQPWYGNRQLAEQFATTLGPAAGPQSFPESFYPPNYGPFFLFDTALPFLHVSFYQEFAGNGSISTSFIDDEFTTGTYAQAVALTPGGSQDNPILPTAPTVFTGPSGAWFDPIAASGFEFTMQDGSLFTEIINFPMGVDGDDSFEVWTGGSSLGWFNVGDSVNFSAGVSNFTITGIDPTVNGDDPAVFPVQLGFNNPTGTFTMIPIPEPSSAILSLLGAVGLVFIRRRSVQ